MFIWKDKALTKLQASGTTIDDIIKPFPRNIQSTLISTCKPVSHKRKLTGLLSTSDIALNLDSFVQVHLMHALVPLGDVFCSSIDH